MLFPEVINCFCQTASQSALSPTCSTHGVFASSRPAQGRQPSIVSLTSNPRSILPTISLVPNLRPSEILSPRSLETVSGFWRASIDAASLAPSVQVKKCARISTGAWGGIRMKRPPEQLARSQASSDRSRMCARCGYQLGNYCMT